MANSKPGKNKTAQKLNSRTGIRHTGKLSCHAAGQYKGNKISRQVHHHGSGGLQPEKIT
jgi:hypothetical protein